MANPLPKHWKKLLGALLAKTNDQGNGQPKAPDHAPSSAVPGENALRSVNEESNRITGWSLLIIGASLLAVLDKDYLKIDGDYKWVYFFYILGWLTLCLSVLWGQKVTRSYLASLFVAKEFADSATEKTNIYFKRQISWFIAGVIVFALWMIFFLALWILNGKTII